MFHLTNEREKKKREKKEDKSKLYKTIYVHEQLKFKIKWDSWNHRINKFISYDCIHIYLYPRVHTYYNKKLIIIKNYWFFK